MRNLAVAVSLFVSLSAVADELSTCREGVKTLEGSLLKCSDDLNACIRDVAACESAPVRALTGGVAKSVDGAAFVSVPPGALQKDTVLTVTRIGTPRVEAPRVSDVYDFGPSLKFAEPATVCVTRLKDPGQQPVCLGYLDETANPPVWKCEDECLKERGDLLCGETSHFTNFAILLGGMQSGGKCDDDDGVGIDWLKKAVQPACDLSADRGLCLFDGAKLASSATTAASVVPLAVKPGAISAGETPAFASTLFALTPAPRTLGLRLNGMRTNGLRVTGASAGKPFSFTGTVVAPDATSPRWRLVVRTSDGRSFSNPTDPPRPDRDAAEGLVTLVARPTADGAGEVFLLSGQVQVGHRWVRWSASVHVNDVTDLP